MPPTSPCTIQLCTLPYVLHIYVCTRASEPSALGSAQWQPAKNQPRRGHCPFCKEARTGRLEAPLALLRPTRKCLSLESPPPPAAESLSLPSVPASPAELFGRDRATAWNLLGQKASPEAHYVPPKLYPIRIDEGFKWCFSLMLPFLHSLGFLKAKVTCWWSPQAHL